MRILVTWASKRGGTADIGRILAEELAKRGFDVVAQPINATRSLRDVDAVVVGSALYANRWLGQARRFVARHIAHLRRVPVWLFSSGPLDESADREDIPPTYEVAVLAERVGANGHVTFGGRLEAGAKGFPASAMAKKKSGDWRNPERVRAWAATLALKLPTASPGKPLDHPAHSVARLLSYGVAASAACALLMIALSRLSSPAVAFLVQVITAPAIFAATARHYFRPRGARDPLVTALAWTLMVAVLEFAVASVAAQYELATHSSVATTWVPLAFVFAAVWAAGTIAVMLPSVHTPQSTSTTGPSPANVPQKPLGARSTTR